MEAVEVVALACALQCSAAGQPYQVPLSVTKPGLYRFRIKAKGSQGNSASEQEGFELGPLHGVYQMANAQCCAVHLLVHCPPGPDWLCSGDFRNGACWQAE